MIEGRHGTESRTPFLRIERWGVVLLRTKRPPLIRGGTTMFFSPLRSRHRVCPPHAHKTAELIRHGTGLIGDCVLIVTAMSLMILAAGCATPKIQPADPQLLFKSDLLSFVRDDVTTREEVVLKLGTPSAQIEGDKILMYQLKVDEDGKWHLVAPQWNTYIGLRTWDPGTCSLVLIFGYDGVLHKHSLVMAQ